MKKDSIGDRMKNNYENRSKTFLIRRTPVIIRIDGKAFHTFTKGMNKPFDKLLMETMQETTKYLCENIQGCKIGYTQSDEITLLLTDYDTLTTDAWFDYNVQKMCSVSASMATLAFNQIYGKLVDKKYSIPISIDFMPTEKQDKYKNKYKLYHNKKNKALFDSRCFTIPKEEVANCFIWRQQDATRNSIQMVGQAYFSQNELNCKNTSDIQDMLMEKYKVNWNDFSPSEKRGTAIIKTNNETERNKWIIDLKTPIFSQNRDYIENVL